ncbi:MAG TPA: formate dehydrogenase accessory sulfurtransferase FdhD [Longimicrobiales bacterium]|nr:formate dehydrogenase accessory sulfurtransferase FdhD [Longimicrobiales bacterium]
MVHPSKSIQAVRLERTRQGASRRTRDWVTVEEPLEIRLAFPALGSDEGVPRERVRSIAVTMRTPGEDFELAAGFLVTEGVLSSRSQLREMTYCRSGQGAQEYNIVEARLRSGEGIDLERLSRNVYTTSSCGVCGKASLEAVEVQGCVPVPAGTLTLSADTLARLPERLLEAQDDFSRTGGIHAAGLFDADGVAVSVFEDVGRHNAVDKVIGAAFLQGRLPLREHAMAVSGRVSFEVVQKAVAAGIPVVAAVGAPSSLAVDLARRFNVTLAGFVRDGGFNLYSAPERIR